MSIDLLRLVDIDEPDYSIEIQFEIMLKWKENRATYNNLKSEEALNALILKQAYLSRKISQGNLHCRTKLLTINDSIQNWYIKEAKKIKAKTRRHDILDSETASLYHYELHRSHLKRKSILKLQIPEGPLLTGHDTCASFLSNKVKEI